MSEYERYMEGLIQQLQTEKDPQKRQSLKWITYAYRYGMGPITQQKTIRMRPL